jgi:hypothetical protein
VVVSGRDPAPVLEPTEHYFEAVASLVAAAVVADLLLPALSSGDAAPYPFVFHCFAMRVGIITDVGQEPLRHWKALQESRRTQVATH